MSAIEGTAEQAAGRREPVGLNEYFSEAGPDYFAWSHGFNMHFGYFRWGMNPFRREAMLEQMNVEVLERLWVGGGGRILDMGCGLGATLRSFARQRPDVELIGITVVPWQVERGTQLNVACAEGARVQLLEGDYEKTELEPGSFDAVYGLESTCYARGADKAGLLREAYRLLKPGGRMVMADGFLRGGRRMGVLQRAIYHKLCECWVIDTLGEVARVEEEMERIGFDEVQVEAAQMRVAPSVFHVPWVTAKFLVTDVLFGSRRMTQARWNNVIAPALLPLVSWPLGPMEYCIVSGTKRI